MEKFKEIDFRGTLLNVGSEGTIFRIKDGKRLLPHSTPDGYEKVTLGARGVTVHIIVATAHVPKPVSDEQLEVNHIDFNRLNNSYTNLEWLTHKENVQYSWKNGRHSPRYGKDNSNYGNKKLSQFYKDNPEISKLKNSRAGLRNGRCVPIELHKDGKLIMKFDFKRLCAEYIRDNYTDNSKLTSVLSNIDKAIKNNKTYKGFNFKTLK